jgi:hypothetical protein
MPHVLLVPLMQGPEFGKAFRWLSVHKISLKLHQPRCREKCEGGNCRPIRWACIFIASGEEAAESRTYISKASRSSDAYLAAR